MSLRTSLPSREISLVPKIDGANKSIESYEKTSPELSYSLNSSSKSMPKKVPSENKCSNLRLSLSKPKLTSSPHGKKRISIKKDQNNERNNLDNKEVSVKQSTIK